MTTANKYSFSSCRTGLIQTLVLFYFRLRKICENYSKALGSEEALHVSLETKKQLQWHQLACFNHSCLHLCASAGALWGEELVWGGVLRGLLHSLFPPRNPYPVWQVSHTDVQPCVCSVAGAGVFVQIQTCSSRENMINVINPMFINLCVVAALGLYLPDLAFLYLTLNYPPRHRIMVDGSNWTKCLEFDL